MRRLIAIALLCTLWSAEGLGQNSHHWTQQYGNKSLLLGGAVSGSVTDLGAVYYNPGFLALQDSGSSFVITARLLQFTSVRIDDGLGEDVDLKRNSMGNASGLIAGTIRLDFLPKSTLAYSVLTRRAHSLDFVFKDQSERDVLPVYPGNEELVTDITLFYTSSEIWGGWSWSRPFNEHLSVGLSNFLAVSYTNSLLDMDLNALTRDLHVVSMERVRQYDYLNLGMIFKAGLALRYPGFTAGLAITAPRINIWGEGYMYTRGIMAGTAPEYTGDGEDYYESDHQEDLPARLRSPLSISAGAGFSPGRMTIHLSAEWFSRVSWYKVMEPEIFIGQTSGLPVINNVVDELESVVNAGIGLRYQLNENFDLYTGFATDFSAASPDSKTFTDLDSEIYNSAFEANIYHFSGGTVLEFNKLYLTLGLSFNYGIDQLAPPVSLPDGRFHLLANEENATLRTYTWKLLLGFAIKP